MITEESLFYNNRQIIRKMTNTIDHLRAVTIKSFII